MAAGKTFQKPVPLNRADDNCVNAGGEQLSRGCTSLMYACQRGLTDTIVKELRTKPNTVHKRDRSKKSALHYCSGQQDLVAAASVAIAAPTLMESADEDGFTPLHLAVIQGNNSLVNLLLANSADVVALDNEGHSVVHWATVCGEVESLRAVLAAGANVSTPDVNGGSPLHYAAQMCGANYDGKMGQSSSTSLALEILGILLAHPGTSVNVVDKDGRPPLLWAASAGSAKAVLALIKVGARVESADKDGLTALHCAASRGHTDCIDALVSLCGTPTDLIDSNGCTALHYAVTLGHADATSLLLDLDADPNRQDRRGRTPAHCGCAKGQLETVKILGARNANLWLRNARGDLPVHEAATSGRRELVQWLLEQKPNQVNTTSNDGRTLLHIAAGNDNTDMCKVLLDFGADVNSIHRTTRNIVMTPLDSALQKGYRSTAKYIQLHGGLPASKLRLSARRQNPLQDQELVKPLRFTENEVGRRRRHKTGKEKKYVIYVKRSDSECDDDMFDRSCHDSNVSRHRRIRCRHHKRRNSCSDTVRTLAECDEDSDGDMARSKSSLEIRRCSISRNRSSSASSGDGGGGGGKGASPDSKCCRQRRKRHKKHTNANQRVREQQPPHSDDDHSSDGHRRHKQMQNTTSQKYNRQPDGSNTFGKVNVDVASMEKIDAQERRQRSCDEKAETNDDLEPPQQHSVSRLSSAARKRPQSARIDVAPREEETAAEKVDTIAEEQVDDSAPLGDAEPSQKQQSDEQQEQLKDPEVESDGGAHFERTTAQVHAEMERDEEQLLKIGFDNVINEMSAEQRENDDFLTDTTYTVEQNNKDFGEPTPSAAVEDSTEQFDLPQDEQNRIVEETNTVDAKPKTPSPRTVSVGKEDRAFSLLSGDTNDEGTNESGEPEDDVTTVRKSSFTVLPEQSSLEESQQDPSQFDGNKLSFTVLDDETVDNDDAPPAHSPDNSQLFDERIVDDNQVQSADKNSRRKRLKKRVRQTKPMDLKSDDDGHDTVDEKKGEHPQQSKDHDSGFEPSPRAIKSTKIPSPRNVNTAMPRRKTAFSTLEERACTSRTDDRKPGDQNAVNMSSVTQSIHKNIRRYYMERKIFQHLLELKSLQIRSSKVNEAILVKRAIDDYHKSILALGLESVGTLRRFPNKEYTFKNFEIFLYETLKGLQKNGTCNFQNISDVYREAERRLSPEYARCERAINCTTKTHRCLHAAHAYTGIPCAAYIPMMNHHTMPKFGFGAYKNTGVGSFYLPKILTSNGKSSGKVSLELSHGSNKQLIQLPSEKLDSNKRYYVTFTVKGNENSTSQRATVADESSKFDTNQLN